MRRSPGGIVAGLAAGVVALLVSAVVAGTAEARPCRWNCAPPPTMTTSASPSPPTVVATSTGTTVGTGLPVGNLPGWMQTVAEDFNTAVPLGSFPGPYAPRFFPYTAGSKDTSGRGTYNAAKTVSVAGGVFDSWLHTESGVAYVSAVVPVSPASQWGQLYGRYSMRMKADDIQGYKLVSLLWPDSDVWAQGEVDYPEVNQLWGGDKVTANIYRNGSWVNIRPGTTDPTDGWHVYTTEWSPGLLKFYVDGALFGQTTVNVPSVSMHWVLQFETVIGGSAPPAGSAGHIQVDWLTVYARS